MPAVRRQFCGSAGACLRGLRRWADAPPGQRVSSVAWQYRSANRSWAPTACGQTLHVASSTRYAVPRSLPSLSLVWGVTSPARQAAPDSDALPAVWRRDATSLACSAEIANPRFVGVVHAGRMQPWELAGSGMLREGHDRRRPDCGGITVQIHCRHGASIARTCAGPVPPKSHRSRRVPDSHRVSLCSRIDS